MALDAATLAAVEAGEAPPTLRLYGFAPPALSLGHGQSEAEIDREACRRLGIDVVRRPTGGRAVLHEAEVTYALVVPAADPRFPPTVPGTYQVVAEALRDAFVALGAGDVAFGPRRASAAADPACFAAASRGEILIAGRKVAGSAQRRTRRAFLQHGSILLDPDPGRLAACLEGADPAALGAAMIGLREALGGRAVGPEEVAGAIEAALGARLAVRLVPGPLTAREAAALAA
jgi:lipoate-protein ligase A